MNESGAGRLRLDVDGELVEFWVGQAGQDYMAVPFDFHVRGLAPAGLILVGRSKRLGVTLESPASRDRVTDYTEGELREMWRAALRREAGT